MPFTIDGNEYFEDINLDAKTFFEMQANGSAIFTSQPSAGAVTALWDKLLEDYDEIIHMPMSSGLSGSCQTAILLAQEYPNQVYVVNNQRISITLRHDIFVAKKLIEKGKDAKEIKDILEKHRFDSTIYITVPSSANLTPASIIISSLSCSIQYIFLPTSPSPPKAKTFVSCVYFGSFVFINCLDFVFL
jgi:DegV family protein with EDD domain